MSSNAAGKALGCVAILLAVILIAFISFAISGRSRVEPRMLNGLTELENKIDAERAVKSRLKDPYSAVFGQFYVLDIAGTTNVCGYVNAKNSFGSYTGEKSYIYSNGVVLMPSDTTRTKFTKAWKDLCGGT